MDNIGKILGPTFGVVFVLFILLAMGYLWRQGYQSEREIEKERLEREDTEQQATAARREGGQEELAFKAVAFDTLSQNSSPPPYTRYAAPRVPEPAVVRVTS
ncbi:hypothetical protein TWF281_000145 [Arthrobotrys megalospora]